MRRVLNQKMASPVTLIGVRNDAVIMNGLFCAVLYVFFLISGIMPVLALAIFAGVHMALATLSYVDVHWVERALTWLMRGGSSIRKRAGG